MLRMLFGNKIASTIVLFVIFLAVWKANNGDLSQIADAAWNALNQAADSLLGIWKNFFP